MNAQVGFWLLHTHILWCAAVMNQAGCRQGWPGSQPEGYTHPDLCRAGCRRRVRSSAARWHVTLPSDSQHHGPAMTCSIQPAWKAMPA